MVSKKTFLLVLVLSLMVGYGFAQEAPPAATPELYTPEIVENPEVKLIDEEGAGKLYQVGEHFVCVLEGTPAEMGFQHGRLLAKKIHLIVKEGYTVKALYDRGYTLEYINEQSDRMEKFFPPEYIEEMKGVVAGLKAAGIEDVTYEEIRAGVTQAEIQHHKPGKAPDLSKKTVRDLSEQCSNFAAWGKWTSDGRLLHGRNLDWNISGGAQDAAVVFVWRPKGGTPFMMLGWAAAIGSVTGMSSNGLTFGEMTSISTDETFDGMPMLLMMRYVLEKAKTLDEGVEIMKTSKRTTGWNFILGDGKIPDGRALEVDAVDCTVFAPMDPKETEETGHWAMEDAVRRTNHPIGMAQIHKLVEIYGPKFGVDPSDIKAALPLLKMQNTWQRYDWLGKQIQANEGKLDIPQCLQMLANKPVGNNATLHSCVFDPKNQVAYVAIAGNNPPKTASQRAYTKIDFTEWFK